MHKNSLQETTKQAFSIITTPVVQLLLGAAILIPWVINIVKIYYAKTPGLNPHLEYDYRSYSGFIDQLIQTDPKNLASFTGLKWYLILLAISYILYKIYTLYRDPKKVQFSFWHIAGFSMLHIAIVSIAYTTVVNLSIGTNNIFFWPMGASAMTLIWHIITLLVYPIFLAFLWRAVGFSALKYIWWWSTFDLRVRIGAEISIGILIFSSLLLLIWAFGMLNLTALLTLTFLLTIAGYHGWRKTYQDIRNRRVEFDQHNPEKWILELINPRLLTTEFAFLVVTFLISVSLINAIRPMPIGWDDLGVYMNFPRIMGVTGHLLEWVGMYTWQLITSTGFLWDQIAAQAFYVNQLGGILSMIVIVSVLSYILELPGKKYILGLPLLLGIIYYVMPMTIFQQAKDMKLDPALMTISVSALWLLWYTLRSKFEHKNTALMLIGIVGLLVGLAFSTKLTTLMLIVASLAYIAYSFIGIAGFIGFLGFFVAIFTKWNLWIKMNVWMPTDNPGLINLITLGCIIVGIIGLGIAYQRTGLASMKRWILSSTVFVGWLIVALSPWLIKNGIESSTIAKTTSTSVIDNLLNGAGGSLNLNNYATIYSPAEYTEKRKAQQTASITSDGKSQNEDFGRYFGQETGLNNYLKLPLNMTFQRNQPGEFTEITYIFLALIPGMLLFVAGRRYRKQEFTRYIYCISIAILLGLSAAYYFVDKSGAELSAIAGKIGFPNGYALFIGITLLGTLFSHFFIADDELGKRIKDTIMILIVYGMLFLISAFGIVWYGVLVYFLMITLIWLAALSFTSYDEVEARDDITYFSKAFLSFLFFISIAIYIVWSALPHGWNNLTSASMNEYKYNKLRQDESIFTYRSDYITPISTLNLKDPQKIITQAASLAQSQSLKAILTPERNTTITANQLHQVLLHYITQVQSAKPSPEVTLIKKDIERIGDLLYRSILSPKPEEANLQPIYRIGTFMTYLINENRKRYLEDSLVFEFDTFFYHPTPETAIDRMRKVGVKYLLVDLNAATIDRDARHALTTRYEHLLATMRARNLKLIDTDNFCLRVALDEHQAGRLQSEREFLDIAGTNYESYSGSRMIRRDIKQNNCANYVVKMMNTGTGTNLPASVQGLKDQLMSVWTQAEQQAIISNAVGQSYFVLFEILDQPRNTPPIINIKPGSTLSGSLQ